MADAVKWLIYALSNFQASHQMPFGFYWFFNPPRTFVSVKKKFQLSSLSNMYVARCFQLIGKSQMESYKNVLCQRLTIDSMMTMIGAKSNFYCQMIHCALCASIWPKKIVPIGSENFIWFICHSTYIGSSACSSQRFQAQFISLYWSTSSETVVPTLELFNFHIHRTQASEWDILYEATQSRCCQWFRTGLTAATLIQIVAVAKK